MIDLRCFCSKDDFRVSLRNPFSHGDFTYATNGVIAVRVARLSGVPEADKMGIPEQLDRIMQPAETATFKPIDIHLPDIQEIVSKVECGDCDGRGVEHECPDCQCECSGCGGSGEVEETEKISVSAFGDIYRLPYLRQILSLPAVEIADIPRSLDKPALFRFDGGTAAIMLMRAEHRCHIRAATPQVTSKERG